MECILHISYRLEFEKWQARGEDKEKVKRRKKNIQDELRKKIGLVVDVPRSGGSGTSNDGNTARRFFRNSEEVAEIVGIKVDLLRRFHVILSVLSSTEEINPDSLDSYCRETANLYVEEYPWFNMPQAVHKMLAHSHQVVRAKNLPIGMLSEEAQEARNKDFKRFREFFTRKTSRIIQYICSQ